MSAFRDVPWFLVYTLGTGLVCGLFTAGAFYWDLRAGLVGGGLAAYFGAWGFVLIHLPLRDREEADEHFRR